jgi:uncharacterized protein
MMFGLRDDDLQIIHAVLAEHGEIESAWIFGSRAKGNYRPGSDVDIALFGRDLARAVSSVAEALNEASPLPYCFDIVDAEALADRDLLGHIRRVGKLLYRRDSIAVDDNEAQRQRKMA